MTPANCPRCGGRLARDNDSGRCAPCQAAERVRLSAPPEVPATFWSHPPLRAALAERHLGRVIRAYRHHPYHGRAALPQAVVAGWLGITQAQLSRVENGPPMVHLDRLAHWAQLLHIPPSALWFSLPGSRTVATVRPVDLAPKALEEGGTTNRRQFHALAALAGLHASGCIDLLTSRATTPTSIGMDHVRYASTLVEEFRRADAQMGADALCDVAIHAHDRLSAWAAKASYSRSVGDALQSALAELAIQAAWLAIDANRRAEARPYLNEAIARARIADDSRVEVRALACMSLLLRQDRPSEAAQCAEAALRASAGWATPRLRTLLHLRAAHAHATLQDSLGYEREMTRVRRAFDGGEHEDDLPFITFVTAQEVTGIQGLSYLVLGRADRAAICFRSVTATPAGTHRRNQLYYTVQFARAANRQGDFESAAEAGLKALPEVGRVRSGRVSALLAEVRSDLAGAGTSLPRVREFIDAHDGTLA
ncbi:helix-turn-helix domain-containing protein [Micromonospora thermarum]|uniref:helix-turn-helix domain-containing protein n=1 Tax=Micromonospora thermarum TaxID=2720024 RepID=UPI0028168797|nr:helix-turn-helix domain-containing protein [Micromonospora thermarum]